MLVSRVEVLQKEYIGGPREEPTTFFSMMPEEASRYRAFRAMHGDLTTTVKSISLDERARLEEVVSTSFLECVRPALDLARLHPVECIVFYGPKEKELCVHTPRYRLFGKTSPFGCSFSADIWFRAEDRLSCTSYAHHHAEEGKAVQPTRGMIDDILQLVFPLAEQDGRNTPFLRFGGFIYFGSLACVPRLFSAVREVLEGIGPERMQDLLEFSALCNESSQSDRRQRLVREAYEHRLREELVRAGFLQAQLPPPDPN